MSEALAQGADVEGPARLAAAAGSPTTAAAQDANAACHASDLCQSMSLALVSLQLAACNFYLFLQVEVMSTQRAAGLTDSLEREGTEF